MAAHSLGQVEAYFTVREGLAEASTVVPPKAGLWREHSAFGRWRLATLGFSLSNKAEILFHRGQPIRNLRCHCTGFVVEDY